MRKLTYQYHRAVHAVVLREGLGSSCIDQTVRLEIDSHMASTGKEIRVVMVVHDQLAESSTQVYKHPSFWGGHGVDISSLDPNLRSQRRELKGLGRWQLSLAAALTRVRQSGTF